jgi:hypothetical protein
VTGEGATRGALSRADGREIAPIASSHKSTKPLAPVLLDPE